MIPSAGLPSWALATLRISQGETTRVLVVLAASGIGGFHAGMVTFPEWQVAVETAQVVAGIVHYPPGNPFYLYHLKLWTILHQIGALLLLSGLSEITLSKILSGLLGMVSLQALAMIVYALSRDVLMSIGAAFLIAFTRTGEYGVSYPIYLMGTTHTYGALGLSLIALIAGLAGAGWYGASAFLLGVAPAVHPSLGAWFALTAVVAAIWHFRRSPSEIRPAWKFFVAGCGVTAISLLVQLAQSRGVPAVDPQITSRYLAFFVAFWDTHRQPVSLTAEGAKLTVGTLALAVAWLKLSSGLPRSAIFMLRVVTITAVLSLVLVLVSYLPPEAVPSTLLILMPGRLLNFNALIAVALLLGLIGTLARSGHGIWSGLLGLYLSIGVFIGNRSMLWEWLEGKEVDLMRTVVRAVAPESRTRPLQILLTVSLLAVATVAVSSWRARRRPPTETAPAVAGTWRMPAIVARGLLLVTLAGATVLLWRLPVRPAGSLFLDRTNDPAFARAAEGPDLLLTGGDMHLVQLRTRRPVLLDGGGLDGLPYALESGPALERILRDVYAIDLFNPPEEARGKGAIPNEVNQAAWQGFSQERWQQIRRTYRVSQVLTDPRWMLALPVAAHGPGFTLYDIPD